ncbi:MAG: outer membrane lipoprotein carrier protein LolA [Acidobacteriota bacterium]
MEYRSSCAAFDSGFAPPSSHPAVGRPAANRRHPGRALLVLAAALSLILVPGAALGDKAPPDPEAPDLPLDERLELLVERVKYEQSRLETMEARFTQNKESLMLLEPEESTGYFWYHAPDRVRWDFERVEGESDAPQGAADGNDVDTVVLISGGEMLTWYRDLGRAERVNVGKQADRVMEYVSAGNSLETLQRYFSLRVSFPEEPDAPYRLRLTPRFERVSKRIKEMALHIDRKGYYPVYLKYVDPDDDVTELHFHDVVVNQAIDDQRFDVDLPADVEVQEVALGGRE